MTRARVFSTKDVDFSTTDLLLKENCIPGNWDEERTNSRSRRGKIIINPELFYVLGALLGDGCVFQYPVYQHQVCLVGDERFTQKYQLHLSKVVNKTSNRFLDKNRPVWFVKINNYELYALFVRCRFDTLFLKHLITLNGRVASLRFIEGFFDAEGCVKIIKEPVRLHPKICLDITNTDQRYLEIIRFLLKSELGIESKYSNQEAYIARDGCLRKKSYHLRIYKKGFVQVFFEHVQTTKITEEKIRYVNEWLELNTNLISPLRSFSRSESN